MARPDLLPKRATVPPPPAIAEMLKRAAERRKAKRSPKPKAANP